MSQPAQSSYTNYTANSSPNLNKYSTSSDASSPVATTYSTMSSPRPSSASPSLTKSIIVCSEVGVKRELERYNERVQKRLREYHDDLGQLIRFPLTIDTLLTICTANRDMRLVKIDAVTEAIKNSKAIHKLKIEQLRKVQRAKTEKKKDVKEPRPQKLPKIVKANTITQEERDELVWARYRAAGFEGY